MLKGKIVLVTGSTSGIGWAIAQAFARQNCQVVLNGLGSAEDIEAKRQEIQQLAGIPAHFSAANMLSAEQIRGMVRETIDRFGTLDVLVNNAGVQHVAPVDEFSEDMWNSILAINLSSAFHSIKASLPGMKQRRWGRIINIASAHGLVASPNKAAYIAAKHGLVGLTKTVALETAGQGVTCNAICPGFVLTPLVEKQIDDQVASLQRPRDDVIGNVLLQRQPSKTFVQVDEVAAMATFLATDDAASITGASMSIDGGWTAQ